MSSDPEIISSQTDKPVTRFRVKKGNFDTPPLTNQNTVANPLVQIECFTGDTYTHDYATETEDRRPPLRPTAHASVIEPVFVEMFHTEGIRPYSAHQLIVRVPTRVGVGRSLVASLDFELLSEPEPVTYQWVVPFPERDETDEEPDPDEFCYLRYLLVSGDVEMLSSEIEFTELNVIDVSDDSVQGFPPRMKLWVGDDEAGAIELLLAEMMPEMEVTDGENEPEFVDSPSTAATPSDRDPDFSVEYYTGDTFTEDLPEDGEPPLRQTRFAPVLETVFAEMYQTEALLPSAGHLLIVRIDPGEESDWELKLRLPFANEDELELTYSKNRAVESQEGFFDHKFLFVCGHADEEESGETAGEITFDGIEVVDVGQTGGERLLSHVTFELGRLGSRELMLAEMMPEMEVGDALDVEQQEELHAGG